MGILDSWSGHFRQACAHTGAHEREDIGPISRSFRLLKRAGTQRRKIVVSLSSCHIARCILYGIVVQKRD